MPRPHFPSRDPPRSPSLAACPACELTSGERELPGGRVHSGQHWVIEHCVGPWVSAPCSSSRSGTALRLATSPPTRPANSARCWLERLPVFSRSPRPSRSTSACGLTPAGPRLTSTSSCSHPGQACASTIPGPGRPCSPSNSTPTRRRRERRSRPSGPGHASGPAGRTETALHPNRLAMSVLPFW